MRIKQIIIAVIVLLVVAGGSGYAGYYLGHKQATSSMKQGRPSGTKPSGMPSGGAPSASSSSN